MSNVIIIDSSGDEAQQPVTSDNDSKNIHQKKVEVTEKVFGEFCALCSRVIEQSHDSEGKEIMSDLKKKHFARPNKVSRSYRKLLRKCVKKLNEGDADIYVYILDVDTELNKDSTVTGKSAVNDSSCNSLKKRPIKEPDDISVKKTDEPSSMKSEDTCEPSSSKSNGEQPVLKRPKLDADQPASSVPSSSVSSPSHVRINTRTPLRIKKLENYLKSLSKEIIRLQSTELSLHDLNNEASNYIQEGKLKIRFMKVYKKLCTLKGSKSITGRIMEKRIHIQSSDFPDINRKIENFVNNPKRGQDLPDYTDILSLVKKAVTKNALGLSEDQICETARKIFTEVGQKMQKRRHKDFVYEFGCSMIDDERTDDDPASSNVVLQEALAHNREVALSSLDRVINKYTAKQDTQEQRSEDRQGNSPQVKVENDFIQ